MVAACLPGIKFHKGCKGFLWLFCCCFQGAGGSNTSPALPMIALLILHSILLTPVYIQIMCCQDLTTCPQAPCATCIFLSNLHTRASQQTAVGKHGLSTHFEIHAICHINIHALRWPTPCLYESTRARVPPHKSARRHTLKSLIQVFTTEQLHNVRKQITAMHSPLLCPRPCCMYAWQYGCGHSDEGVQVDKGSDNCSKLSSRNSP
jgi:hypothetical protein